MRMRKPQDELCHELRDKTRCSAEGSEDGGLVIHKNDVCAVFRSIPARAKAMRAAKARRDAAKV